MKCEVCNAAESKYRCPKCRARYCSLVCFKAHKKEEQGAAQGEEEGAPVCMCERRQMMQKKKKQSEAGSPDMSRNHSRCSAAKAREVDPELVPRQVVERMLTQGTLDHLLGDARLQQAIKLVMESDNPREALRLRRVQNPNFAAAADELLIAAGWARRLSNGAVVFDPDLHSQPDVSA